MLGAIPLVDGATYSFDEYYRRSFAQIAKAAEHHILFHRIGNPKYSDSLYKEMRTAELAEVDRRLQEQWEREFPDAEAAEYQRVQQCLKWREKFDLRSNDLPCFVFITQGKRRVGLLRIADGWYESEPCWRVFLRCFCPWLEAREVREIATAELSDAVVSNRLSELLQNLAREVDQRLQTSSHLDELAWYATARLAELFGVGKEALRKRLDRYRGRNDVGWKENEGRRPREAKYLYRLMDVRHIIEALRASSQRPAK